MPEFPSIDPDLLPPLPGDEPAPGGDDGHDDETALARMLASETSNAGARVVVGWQTIERARRRAVSLFRLLTGEYGTYGGGPSKRPGVYASTARAPTAQTRSVARELLAGELQPSAEIRAHGLGAWVERGLNVSDEGMLKLQKSARGGSGFGGIWARLEGTDWYLYDGDEPALEVGAGESAAQVLDRVRTVPSTA